MAENTPDDLVGELRVAIGHDFRDALTALAAEFTSAYNDGLRAGYDVDHAAFRGITSSQEGVTLVFTAEILGTPATPYEPHSEQTTGPETRVPEESPTEKEIASYTEPCGGCEDPSPHDSHLTAAGRRHYLGEGVIDTPISREDAER